MGRCLIWPVGGVMAHCERFILRDTKGGFRSTVTGRTNNSLLAERKRLSIIALRRLFAARLSTLALRRPELRLTSSQSPHLQDP